MRSKSQKRRREIGSFCRNHSSLSLCTPSVYVNICLGGGCNLLSCMTHTIYCEWQLLADLWRMTTAEVSLRLTAVMGKKKKQTGESRQSFPCLYVHTQLSTMPRSCSLFPALLQSFFISSVFFSFMIPSLRTSHQTHALRFFGKALFNRAGRNMCATEIQGRASAL